MGKFYDIQVSDDNSTVASASGSLGLVSYAERELRDAVKRGDVKGEVTAKLAEVETVGGAVTRIITSISADAETVSLVLKTKLAGERKEASAVTEDSTAQA